ncbi:hypothetical protein PoB_005549100 [Plakobranchus ocellatus]|uniref:Uncharacterized protein n=1 Tax=Plakobranchus ocellatus TaxID=259542 RepID=A0AAV4C8E2_9GAST|nr:hypothetical protein PoB_005549100 [Plakobranchus ocellatus]
MTYMGCVSLDTGQWPVGQIKGLGRKTVKCKQQPGRCDPKKNQATPQQGDLRLSGPPSGRGPYYGARTHDRRILQISGGLASHCATDAPSQVGLLMQGLPSQIVELGKCRRPEIINVSGVYFLTDVLRARCE